MSGLSEKQIADALRHLSNREKEELYDLMQQHKKAVVKKKAQREFLPFVQHMWPGFVHGRHHEIMADAFERIARGELKRLTISLAPRHTKSEFGSHLFPAWFMGLDPTKKIIQCSNTADLATDFGRKVRDTIMSPEYQELFPNTTLAADAAASGKWKTSKKGEYFAIGTGGRVTGRGGDLIIIDDPHALEITTEIPTPKGFVRIGDLKVGDDVFGPDGLPTKVVAKSDVYHNRELFSVVTDDGEEILCDAKHLWSYRRNTRLTAGHLNMTAEDMAEWNKKSKPCIPRHRPVHYPERDLPIDPYVLGAWLGDGTATAGRITCHLDDYDFIRQQFEDAGYETTDQKDPHNFGVLGLWSQLRRYNLYDNKHIPGDYLIASVEQRMALLQGLMDTDGHVNKSGACSFDNTNLQIIRGVRELLHSLGLKVKLCCYPVTKGYSDKTVAIYRLNFKLKDAARLPRKRERTYTATDKMCRSLEVRRTDKRGSVQCITVDREDGLFLCGRGYVVTHNSEQEARQAESNPEIFDDVYRWYTSGPRQRVQPGAALVIIATRWSKRDLIGQVLKAAEERDGEKWEVIELPAVLPSGKTLWPEYWPPEEIFALRDELPVSKWLAQYQQTPTSEEGALIKREWWQKWEGNPPACKFIMQSWDTAFMAHERADYSACTTWGVFEKEHPETGKKTDMIILLDAFRERMEFPRLKKVVMESYNEWQPDSVIVEKRASGQSLIQELRTTGIPVSEFTPTRGNDKIVRVNAVSDIFASGMVYAPERRWADEVINEVAEFPSGEHDDYVDTVTQALLRFRQGGFVRTLSDEEREDMDVLRATRREYY